MLISLEKCKKRPRLLAKISVIGVFFSVAVMLPAQSLMAQDQAATQDKNSASEGTLEEIVVTARRYEETLEDAPVAVNVLSGDMIGQSRIQRADDIMDYTPGATWESFSKMQPVASLRGIIAPTPGNSSSEASIQTVVDDVVISKDFMKAPPIFDLNRVEVLRGPQGTAFGRNASVGLIHFVNNRPSQERSGKVTATFGTDELREYDGFINGGITDTLSGRLAFNHDQQDGPTESISTGKGLDGDENTAVRLSLLFEPNEDFSAYFKMEYSVDRDDAPVRHGYQQPNGKDCSIPFVRSPPYKQTYFDDCSDPFKEEISAEDENTDFHTDRDIYTGDLQLVWNLSDDLTLTSITGYMKGDTDSLMDLIGTPNDVAFQQVRNNGHSFSQEVRIDNEASDSRFHWLTGVYYLTDTESRFEENQFQPRNARSFPFVPTFLATFSHNVTKSYSAFTELNYDLTERITLTYGGRYVHDSKRYIYGVRASGFCGQIAGVEGLVRKPGPPICGTPDNPLGFSDFPVLGSWDKYIPKASVSFAINDNTNIYAVWSRGFKSGTFQPDARNKASVEVVVNPETSKNYEIGLKGASKRYRYSLSAYYLENHGTQTINLVPVGAGFTGLISNVGAVESKGIEGELTVLATDNFLVSGNFALISAELRNTPDPSDLSIDISGKRAPGAPNWTYTLFGEYTFRLSNGSSLKLRADARGRSDVFNQTSNRNTNPPKRLRPKVKNWGARVSWLSATGNLDVSFWGKNLNEDVDIENFGPPSPCCSTFAAGFRNKRSYGVTVSYGF